MTSDPVIESVWEYPRPPRLERIKNHLRVMHGGVVLAETTNAVRVLETSHPPVYYLPPADVAIQFLEASSRPRSYCEFKGLATYWNIDLLDSDQKPRCSPDAAWSYGNPSQAYVALREYFAFYASRVDECTVDGEVVCAQPATFMEAGSRPR